MAIVEKTVDGKKVQWDTKQKQEAIEISGVLPANPYNGGKAPQDAPTVTPAAVTPTTTTETPSGKNK